MAIRLHEPSIFLTDTLVIKSETPANGPGNSGFPARTPANAARDSVV